MFNEATVLLVSYHLFLFTQAYDSPEREYDLGWSVVLITLANLLTNMTVLIVQSIKALKAAYKAWRDKKVKISIASFKSLFSKDSAKPYKVDEFEKTNG